jgi:hypothetical protein
MRLVTREPSASQFPKTADLGQVQMVPRACLARAQAPMNVQAAAAPYILALVPRDHLISRPHRREQPR